LITGGLFKDLRLSTPDGDDEQATALVHGFLLRVNLNASEDGPHTPAILAGRSGDKTPADQYCNIGCGGWI
jgi:hypothetical protein